MRSGGLARRRRSADSIFADYQPVIWRCLRHRIGLQQDRGQGRDHGVDLARVDRRAEVVALRQATAFGVEHRELLGALDALGDRVEAEAAAEAEERAQDRLRARIVLQRADEGAVELDLVEREAAQIAERGMADAEIVERDPHAQPLELAQRLEIGLGRPRAAPAR